jgi:putative peptidoglycan lipid II flippase
MLGFSIVALDELIMKRFGTDLGEGAVAQLHYARTLMRVPMGVFGLALGMATFPTLSRYCAEGAPRRALNLLTRSLKALLLLASLSEVALTACSAELAALIWGRARITDLGLASIGLYCSAMSVGLWAWAAHGLVARGFYARGQTWRPTLLGSVVTLCAVPLYLTAARKGALALCFASSTAISVYVASLWWWVRASLLSAPSELNLSEEEPVEPLAVELLKVTCVTLVGVGVALALDHHLGGVTGWGEGSVGLVWSGALKLCGALSASLTLAFVCKVEVLGELKARLSDKLTRR